MTQGAQLNHEPPQKTRIPGALRATCSVALRGVDHAMSLRGGPLLSGSMGLGACIYINIYIYTYLLISVYQHMPYVVFIVYFFFSWV